MTRRKYEDLTLAAPKYRCCFGYLHVQTLTTIACILLFLNSSHDAYKYLSDFERNDWEFFKIIVALGSAAGPLIGINKKKSLYFFTYFIHPIVRSFYYSLILLSLIFTKIFPNTDFGKKFNANFNDKDSRELEKMLRNIPLLVFLFIFVSLLFVLEAWVCYVIYKCYKYIGALSFQGCEYGYQAKKQGKIKSNNSKEPTKDAKPLNKISLIKKYSGYSFIEKLFFKKAATPSEVVKAQTKLKTPPTDTTVEHEVKLLKPKTSASIQTLTYERTNSKPVECNLNIQLNNHIEKTKVANITVKLKSAEKLIEKVTKRISSMKQEMLKPKASEANQMKTVTAASSKPVESHLEIKLKNNLMKNAAAATFTVKLKSTDEIQKVIKSPLIVKPSAAESESYFEQSYISNTLKPKKFVSIEIQTDETSFNQRTVKNRFKNFDYDSETDSVSPTTSLETEEYITDEKSIITSSSGFASTSDFSPFESVSPNSEANVTFLFKNDETCAVEIYQNGKNEKLKNLFDNEWTPLYFSMAQKNPEIGEKAQIHFHHFREHVLYDIFKIIGKSLDKIKIDPEWKFKIVEKNGIKYFQIKTQNGLNLFPENIILATFLKSMKGLAENYLNSEIHEINVSSNFQISESQKSVFKNAASKIHLKILSFRENNF